MANVPVGVPLTQCRARNMMKPCTKCVTVHAVAPCVHATRWQHHRKSRIPITYQKKNQFPTQFTFRLAMASLSERSSELRCLRMPPLRSSPRRRRFVALRVVAGMIARSWTLI